MFEAQRLQPCEDLGAAAEQDAEALVVKVCSLCDEAQQEAVENERRILKKLKSAYVARLEDDFIDTEAKKAYLVLERAGDVSLERLVKNSPHGLTLDQVKSIARQLASAVAYLHENLIVHRDIKPDNIMLEASATVLKLIDFNIAHDLAVCPEIKGASGLRAWSAPETRMLKSYDERCDLWSIGCVVYYACTGAAPFDEDDPLDLSDALIAQAIKRFGPSSDSEQLAALLTDLL